VGKKMRELFEKYLKPPKSPKGDFDYVLLISHEFTNCRPPQSPQGGL